MLTVKLCKGHTMKIVEASEVEIFPCGRAPNSDAEPEKRTNSVREIAVTRWNGSHDVFYVSDGPVNDKVAHSGVDVEYFDCAYIENAHGATTEKVHAY
ncbi:MAG TPA: hypothetical protein VKW06_00525 [Candidatus Angelobacter sp.]|nr:hypothetical protein [Candidatus Angelobacter sp.]